MNRSSELSIAGILVGILAVALMGVVAATPAKAQTGDPTRADAKTTTMLPVYDMSKEVKVEGTIQKIDTTGTNGVPGTLILVQTAGGVVDAHLGTGAASRPQYLGIATGQSVSVIGMMQTLGATSVLLARVLTTPDHIFVLRNEHGIPVRATPRGSTHAQGLQKGL